MTNWKYVAAAVAATAIAGSAHAASLAYDATLAPPGYYNGTGNSSDHFTTNTQDGVELGLGVQYRYTGPQVTPIAGTSTYDVNTGTSTTNCGGGNCSLWNYEYSINLGSSGLTLADITPSLTVLNEANNNIFTVPITFFPDNAGYSGTPGNYSYDTSATSTDLGEQNSQKSWLLLCAALRQHLRFQSARQRHLSLHAIGYSDLNRRIDRHGAGDRHRGLGDNAATGRATAIRKRRGHGRIFRAP